MGSKKPKHLPTPSDSSNSTISSLHTEEISLRGHLVNYNYADHHRQDFDLRPSTPISESKSTTTQQGVIAYKFTGCEHIQVPVDLDNPLPAIDVEFVDWYANIAKPLFNFDITDIRGTCYACHSKQLCARCCLCFIATVPKPVKFCECGRKESLVRSRNLFDGQPVQEPKPYLHNLWREVFVRGRYAHSTKRRQEQLFSEYKRLKEQLLNQRKEIAMELSKSSETKSSQKTPSGTKSSEFEYAKWDRDMELLYASERRRRLKQQHAEEMENFVLRNCKIPCIMKNRENPDPSPHKFVRLAQLSTSGPSTNPPSEHVRACSQETTEAVRLKSQGSLKFHLHPSQETGYRA